MGNYFMDKINEIFFDHSNDIKKYLFDCFMYLYDNDNFVVHLFESLCKVKEVHPEFVIKFSNTGVSEFDCKKNELLLGRKNFLIFTHEVGHVIHYYYNEYRVVDNFYILQQKIENNKDIINNSKSYLDILEKRIRTISDMMYDPKYSDEECDKLLLEQKSCLEAIDFIDAIFGGKTGYGHGSVYYNGDTNKEKAFSEMFATYVSIRSFSNSKTIIKGLELCFGNELFNLFDSLFNDISLYYYDVDKKEK